MSTRVVARAEHSHLLHNLRDLLDRGKQVDQPCDTLLAEWFRTAFTVPSDPSAIIRDLPETL